MAYYGELFFRVQDAPAFFVVISLHGQIASSTTQP